MNTLNVTSDLYEHRYLSLECTICMNNMNVQYVDVIECNR